MEMTQSDQPVRCHVCKAEIEGEVGAHGFILVLRDDVPRFERPPLCERCAHAIGISAITRYDEEEEEG
jgi:hypothetical protein